MTAAAAPPAETGVTVGRHASVRTPPPPEWLAAPEFDAPPPPSVRRRRRTYDTRLAAGALLLVGLVGLFLGVLPRFWRPAVGPTPPRQLALPTLVSPAPPVPAEPPEPAEPARQAAPDARAKVPATQLEPEEADPRKARFRAKLKALEWLFGPPQDLTYSTGGRIAAFVSRQGVVRFWDVDEPKELLFLTAGAVRIAFFPDDSRVLAADGNGTMHLWDLVAGAEVRRFGGRTAKVVFLSLSPDGARVLTGYEEPNRRTSLRMWDLNQASEVTDAAGWRAAWVEQAAAVVPEPIWPACAEETGPATFTLQTLQVPRRPVEVEDGEPFEPAQYLLSTTTGRETTSEIVQVDDDR